MMVRKQATPEHKLQKHSGSEERADVTCIFDLGVSGDSDISKDKDSMVAEALIPRARKSDAKNGCISAVQQNR